KPGMGVRIPPPLPGLRRRGGFQGLFYKPWRDKEGKYGDAGGKDERRDTGRRFAASAAGCGHGSGHQDGSTRNARGDEEGDLADSRRCGRDNRSGAGDRGVFCDLFVLRGAGCGTCGGISVEAVWSLTGFQGFWVCTYKPREKKLFYKP